MGDTEIKRVLPALPNEIYIKIQENLSDGVKYNLSRCNKHLYELHKQSASKYVCQFLLHFARGQKEQAENLLIKYPHLLLETGTVIDYSGRKIKGTAYQIALGAEDTEMWQMTDKYFAKLKNENGQLIGEEEKKKQFDAQFPDGNIENKPSDYNFSALAAVISNDKFDNNLPNAVTEAAIKKFQDDFTPNPEDVITTGKHFNMQHLIKAYEIYNSNYDTWSYGQCSLFWRQVIGHLQRQIPACYAQAYCTGLFNVAEHNEPLERKFDLDDGAVFFPLDRDPASKLGRDVGVYSYSRWARLVRDSGSPWSGPGSVCSARVVEKLCRAKTSELGKLKTHLHPASQPGARAKPR